MSGSNNGKTLKNGIQKYSKIIKPIDIYQKATGALRAISTRLRLFYRLFVQLTELDKSLERKTGDSSMSFRKLGRYLDDFRRLYAFLK